MANDGFMRHVQQFGRALRAVPEVSVIDERFELRSRRSGKSVVMEQHIQTLLNRGERVLIMSGKSCYTLRPDDPCDEWDPELIRPSMPHGEDMVFYRGWECGWDQMREFYTGNGYTAYKGGVDLGAPRVDAGSWNALLDAVDNEESE